MRNVIVLLALASGCYKDNPNYDGGDAGPDSDDMTGPACETSEDCTGSTPVCDDRQCVQCTAVNQEACAPSLVCGADNQCRNCESHAECVLSQACLSSGQCAEVDDVAYVVPGGTGLDCTQEAPCATLDQAVERGRPVIKLGTGRTPSTETVRLTDRAIEVVAEEGAQIASGPDSVIRLDGRMAAATVSDVTVIGAAGQGVTTAAFSVSELGGELALHRVTVHLHRGPAIGAAGGELIVDRCNLVQNTGGGITVTNAHFSITSSLIVTNGSATSAFGGVQITRPVAGSKFAFNTVAGNVSPDPLSSGMDCTPGFAFTSSIVRTNPVTSTCTASYTLFEPPLVAPAGANNVAGLANFLETDPASYDQPAFYRIAEDSDASDVAMPDDDVTMDIDGDLRSATPDMGADEN